jgi:alkanesulfonate monooxygenase SsuD/methylene tetrahydromethanopterin reductase-like flavin-dependent oxidoreductase (luciferase family)
MRVGLHVPNFTSPGEPGRLGDQFGSIAQQAERAGCASRWVTDHCFQISVQGPPENETLES